MTFSDVTNSVVVEHMKFLNQFIFVNSNNGYILRNQTFLVCGLTRELFYGVCPNKKVHCQLFPATL